MKEGLRPTWLAAVVVSLTLVTGGLALASLRQGGGGEPEPGPDPGPTTANSQARIFVDVPAFRIGDQATFWDATHHRFVDVRIGGLETRVAPDGRPHDALVVHYQSPEGGLPRIEQAIDPTTGRIVRTTNSCFVGVQGASTFECDNDWRFLRFDAWDAPGILGAALVAGRPWSVGDEVTRTLHGPGGPTALTYTASSLDAAGNVVIDVGADGLVQVADATGGIVNATMVFGPSAPFPLQVVLKSAFGPRTTWNLQDVDRGEGDELSFDAGSLGERAELLRPPTVMIGPDRLVLKEREHAWILSPGEALRLASTHRDVRTFRERHPSAALTDTYVEQPRQNVESIGSTYSRVTQTISFTFAENGSSGGITANVKRTETFAADVMIDSRTDVSTQEAQFGLGTYGPFSPAITIRNASEAIQRFARMPGLPGPYHGVSVSDVTDVSGFVLATRLVLTMDYSLPAACQNCISIQRQATLALDLELGMLENAFVPGDVQAQIDEDGL